MGEIEKLIGNNNLQIIDKKDQFTLNEGSAHLKND